jgi:hypothetical protein
MKYPIITYRTLTAAAMAMLFVAGYSVRAANVNWTNSNNGG